MSISRLEARVRAVGAEVGTRYGHLVVEVGSLGHASRARAQSERVRGLSGVVDGAVSIEGVVRVEFDTTATTDAQILTGLGSLGLRPVSGSPRRPLAEDRAGMPDHDEIEAHGDDDGHDHGHGSSRVELGAALISLVIYLVARSLDWFTDSDGPVIGLYVSAAVLTGVFVARDAWLSVRARVFDIDQLMLIAAIGAAFIGHWSDSALLLVLFSLGHALEGYAMNRARNAIEALGELAPATARRADYPDVEVPIGELVVGDVVVVRPNERLPADGVIVKGQTAIDESAVTGESVPVDKSAMANPAGALDGIESISGEHRVFAGTLNGPGAIDVMVLRVAADSTLARVVQLVAEAETQISPTQRLTKRIVRVFVPSVLALVAFLLVVPPLAGEAFTDSFARAMAVLVAASPCALAIATPSAVLAAIARAARAGILVKGGGPLEALGNVDAIAFDKTGTITEGKPILTDVEPADGVDEAELLRVTLAVERDSDHPIARAVTAGVTQRLGDAVTAEAAEVKAVTGKGVTGAVDGLTVMIGNSALFEDVTVPAQVQIAKDALESGGRTTMIVRHGDRFLGVLGVMDTPRSDATSAINKLRTIGIDTIVMLSGDNQRVATAVAAEVGITEARGGLLPADKVDAINKLASRGGVAMIGDGVNDAPALAAANVGIAMGAAGSDVALETADIALMADRLEHLPVAVGLARRASRTIKQNLFFSLAVVAALIPMTILGVGISVAVIAHEGSTLVVVANALLLLNYRHPE
ncbi:MAG: heavy metal translocating P-type ATPase [Acidimicrobiia bacterium]|nr:heavy metal translocating P-type ATPase [Acidimicrobiia bacterium]